MSDLTLDKFSLTETLIALRTIEARVEKYSVSSFVFFSLSAMVVLTGEKISLNGLSLTSDVAATMLFCIGVFCLVSRTLNFLGSEIYKIKLQELHQKAYGTKGDVWSYIPNSTLAFYTVLQSIGEPGKTFKRIFALGFMAPMAVSFSLILKTIDFSTIEGFGFIDAIFACSSLLLLMSYSLEFQICFGEIPQKVKKVFDQIL
ncbi:hypothetical protein AB6D33_25735 [Vibrio splendidus]